MPELPAKPGATFGDLLITTLRLFYDPTSLESSAHLVKGWHGATVYALWEHFGADTVALSRSDIEAIAHATPGAVPTGRKYDQIIYDCFTAGHVLVYTLRLARQAPRVASAATAMRILERRYLREGEASSPTSIKTAWLRFRPIAPFVAATVQIFTTATGLEYFSTLVVQPDGRDSSIRFAPNVVQGVAASAKAFQEDLDRAESVLLPQLFALAEAFRWAGEHHFATGQEVHGHSLLDPETTWRVPKSFPLPAVEMHLPPLDADELEAALVK